MKRQGEETILERGDYIRIRPIGSNNEWIVAMVTLASGNGRSLMIQFSGTLAGDDGYYVGTAPLSIDYSQESVEGLFGGKFEIELPGESFLGGVG